MTSSYVSTLLIPSFFKKNYLRNFVLILLVRPPKPSFVIKLLPVSFAYSMSRMLRSLPVRSNTNSNNSFSNNSTIVSTTIIRPWHLILDKRWWYNLGFQYYRCFSCWTSKLPFRRPMKSPACSARFGWDERYQTAW
jgi:hypothetical protein